MYKRYLIISLLLVSIISCTEKKETTDLSALKSKGDSLIAQTFDTLRNTLLSTIGEKGFPGAVSFCNTKALSLTNTYAAEGITIKRTSDKLRNPANRPDNMEQEILSAYLQMKEDKQELKPVLKKDTEGNHHYFKPILLQAMCSNCHGDKNTQIKPDTWEVIRLQYPADAAYNYKEGDLRGIWHLTFLKNKINGPN